MNQSVDTPEISEVTENNQAGQVASTLSREAFLKTSIITAASILLGLGISIPVGLRQIEEDRKRNAQRDKSQDDNENKRDQFSKFSLDKLLDLLKTEIVLESDSLIIYKVPKKGEKLQPKASGKESGSMKVESEAKIFEESTEESAYLAFSKNPEGVYGLDKALIFLVTHKVGEQLNFSHIEGELSDNVGKILTDSQSGAKIISKFQLNGRTCLFLEGNNGKYSIRVEEVGNSGKIIEDQSLNNGENPVQEELTVRDISYDRYALYLSFETSKNVAWVKKTDGRPSFFVGDVVRLKDANATVFLPVNYDEGITDSFPIRDPKYMLVFYKQTGIFDLQVSESPIAAIFDRGGFVEPVEPCDSMLSNLSLVEKMPNSNKYLFIQSGDTPESSVSVRIEIDELDVAEFDKFATAILSPLCIRMLFDNKGIPHYFLLQAVYIDKVYLDERGVPNYPHFRIKRLSLPGLVYVP